MLQLILALNIIFNPIGTQQIINKKYLHVGTSDICEEYTDSASSHLLDEEIDMPTEQKKGNCIYSDSRFIDLSDFAYKDALQPYVTVIVFANDLNFRFSNGEIKIKGKQAERTSAYFDLSRNSYIAFENMNVRIGGSSDKLTLRNSDISYNSFYLYGGPLIYELEESSNNLVIPDITSNIYLVGINQGISVNINSNCITDDFKFNLTNIQLSIGDSENPLTIASISLNDAKINLGANIVVSKLEINQYNDLEITDPDQFKGVEELSIHIGKNILGSVKLSNKINIPSKTTILANLVGSGQLNPKTGSILIIAGQLDKTRIFFDTQEYFKIACLETNEKGSNILYINKDKISSTEFSGFISGIVHLLVSDTINNVEMTIDQSDLTLDVGSYNVKFVGTNNFYSLHYENKNWEKGQTKSDKLEYFYDVQTSNTETIITIKSVNLNLVVRELPIQNNKILKINDDSGVNEGTNRKVFFNDLYSIIKSFEFPDHISLTIENVLSTTLTEIPNTITLSKNYYLYIKDDETAIFKIIDQEKRVSYPSYDLTYFQLEGKINFISELESPISLKNNLIDSSKLKLVFDQKKFTFLNYGVFYIAPKNPFDFADYYFRTQERDTKDYSTIFIDEEKEKMIEYNAFNRYSINTGEYDRVYMVRSNLDLQDQKVKINAFYYNGNSPIIGENAQLIVGNLFVTDFGISSAIPFIIPRKMSIRYSLHIPESYFNFVVSGSNKKVLEKIEHLYVVKSGSITIEIIDSGFKFDNEYIPETFKGAFHFEILSPTNDLKIKIKDETNTNSKIKKIDGKNIKNLAYPFSIDIKGQPKDDFKIIFDISEMQESFPFKGPITYTLPTGLNIDNILAFEKDGSTTNKPEYFDINKGESLNENADNNMDIEEPDDDPNEKPDDDPNEKPGDNPNEKPGDNPNEKPGDNPNEKPGDNPNEKPDGKSNKFPTGGIVGIVIGCIIVIAVVIVIVFFVLKKKKENMSNDEQSEMEDAQNI